MRIFTACLLLIGGCAGFSLKGQIKQPERIEIDHKASDGYWNVISAHEFGVVLFREKNSRSESGDRLWEVKVLDTSLKLLWGKEYPSDRRYTFKGYDYSNNQLFILLQEGSFDRGEFMILRIFLSNGKFKAYHVPNDVPLHLEEFMAVGESVVFGGYANNLPAVLLYNFVEEKLKVIPGFYQKDAYLIDLTVDDVNNSFTAVVNERHSSDHNLITLKTFDNFGELVTDKEIRVDDDVNVLSAETTTFDWGEQVVTGTFGEKNSDLAKGVYFLRVQHEGEPILLYYNFSNLQNYFNYLSARQKEKIDKKIEARKSKGKDINVKSRIILHELIPEGDEYIMLGEVYEVNYSNLSSSPYGTPYWMNTFNYGYRGYRVTFPDVQPLEKPATFEYQQAIVAGFSRNGDLKWDNSLVLDHLYAPYLSQVVHVNTVNQRIVLIYKEESELISEVIRKGEPESQTLKESIGLKFDGDVLKSEKIEFSGLSYWYEDNFYTWGYQRIRNKTNKQAPKRRDVFYINKITIN